MRLSERKAGLEIDNTLHSASRDGFTWNRGRPHGKERVLCNLLQQGLLSSECRSRLAALWTDGATPGAVGDAVICVVQGLAMRDALRLLRRLDRIPVAGGARRDCARVEVLRVLLGCARLLRRLSLDARPRAETI